MESVDVEECFDIWLAFCTIHWFATGNKIIGTSKHDRSYEFYIWFLNL